jgi:thiol-disulfide isomerase/thioredoxin
MYFYRRFCFVFLLFISQSLSAQNTPRLQLGYWKSHLQLNDSTQMPFKLMISKNKENYIFSIHNAEEIISLTDVSVLHGDSLRISFPNFHSSLIFKADGRNFIKGYWQNFEKGTSYKIPFFANFSKVNTGKAQVKNDISGRWKTLFGSDQKDLTEAIGIFKQSNSSVTGTFLTETGDYRFLEGTFLSEKLSLSAFDGSHAFYFKANLINDSLIGTFYSGKHYATTWVSSRNESFELKHPDSLTYLIKNEAFSFKLKDLNGKDFNFPNPQFNNKVTIIQIMGTWCPNCMDETVFFKELHEKYNKQGLEIISIGYETPNDFKEQAEKIQRLKERHDLKFTFLVGGKANKGLASQHFAMLNEVISFPTSIFIGKDGQVKKIHTGFNGPGTGEIYSAFKEETIHFIEELLK